MRLQIDSREVSGVTVLDLDGQLVMGIETQTLCDRVHQLIAEQKTKILINAGKIFYIDSFGVGELVACLTTAVKNGGSLKFASPSDFVRDVLRAVRLMNVLELYDTEEEAIASFAG